MANTRVAASSCMVSVGAMGKASFRFTENTQRDGYHREQRQRIGPQWNIAALAQIIEHTQDDTAGSHCHASPPQTG